MPGLNADPILKKLYISKEIIQKTQPICGNFVFLNNLTVYQLMKACTTALEHLNLVCV